MTYPAWLDRTLYPFKTHRADVGPGAMNYIDEGTGPTLLMVHGTPTWSFLYRNLISELSRTYRCVAPDHLGFGLSDKPSTFSYTPEAHADNLSRFIAQLGLHDITLMVHDYGGPIGLAYALEHPENVGNVVVFNTWLWSHEGNRAIENGAKVAASPLGRMLYRHLNFSPRVLLKSGFADKKKLTSKIHQHYLSPFPTAQSRMVTWQLARALTGSSPWFDSLWSRRTVLQNKPALVLWGMKDPFLPPSYLERWREVLSGAKVVTYESAGHFVQEEAWLEAAHEVDGFLQSARLKVTA